MAKGRGTFLQQIGDIAKVLSGTKTSGQGPTLSGLQQGRHIQELTGQLGQQFERGARIQDSPQLAQLAGINPQAAQNISGIFGQIGEQRERQLFEDAEETGIRLDSGDVQGAVGKLNTRIQQITLAGGDPADTQEILTALESGDFSGAKQGLDATRKLGRQLGVLKAGAAQKPTSLQQNLAAAGLEPGSPEFQAAVLASVTKPQTAITIGADEGKEREEIAKVRGRQFERLLVDAEASEKTIDSLNQLDAIDAATGALEPLKASFAAVAEGFGIDASGLANVETAQAFTAASNRLVNNVLNQAKGPQTEGDAQRAKSTIANLGDSPLAAQFKTDALRAVSLRTVEQRDFIEGQVDEGATFSKGRSEWNKFKRKTPSLSAVVKNPQTGLPVFFWQFQRQARSRRPGIADADIIAAWRQVNGGK